MSLIIAAVKEKTAIIGGDKRSITFLGDCKELEKELYSGKLKTDEELIDRTRELHISIQVSDAREKVWRIDNILVGEVSEISPALQRRRRIYIVPGAYILVDIKGNEAKVIGKGGIACMILGNKFTQELAKQEIKDADGRLDETVVENILTNASKKTPSVSKEHCVLSISVQQINPEAAVLCAFLEDSHRCGWRLCDQQ